MHWSAALLRSPRHRLLLLVGGLTLVGFLQVLSSMIPALSSSTTRPGLAGSADQRQRNLAAGDKEDSCSCEAPTTWYAQAGQDKFLFEGIFSKLDVCCNGFFVEFGARNGIQHSNTLAFENMGWKGLLFEVDPKEYEGLISNRPNSVIKIGPICPSYQTEIEILLSIFPGLSGQLDGYEPERANHRRDVETFACLHLAQELKENNISRVDYMTIDTEGSEIEILKDFPWNEFDVRVVQVEQLNEMSFPSQRGRKQEIIDYMTSMGYTLYSVFVVSEFDTDDLIFVRNILR